MIQIGMHRYRFGDTTDSRWFSFTVMESTQLGSIKLNFCWNRLFAQKWERNTVLISTRIKLIKDFYLQSGAVAYFTPEFSYSPFILLSTNIKQLWSGSGSSGIFQFIEGIISRKVFFTKN